MHTHNRDIEKASLRSGCPVQYSEPQVNLSLLRSNSFKLQPLALGSFASTHLRVSHITVVEATTTLLVVLVLHLLIWSNLLYTFCTLFFWRTVPSNEQEYLKKATLFAAVVIYSITLCNLRTVKGKRPIPAPQREDRIVERKSSLGRYVFGSEISYNKAPPRLPGLGC